MPEASRILVIDLLGGIGDLLMLLPSIHALARCNPRAELAVLTHAPGTELLLEDPLVSSVVAAAPHEEAETVSTVLAAYDPDLVVSTTNHGDVPDRIRAHGCRSITNLWRDPPVNVRVGARYADILHAEGLVGQVDSTPSVFIRPNELVAARRTLASIHRRSGGRWVS
ncbi:MAG: hypothetical protein JOZ47_06485 [Kutzneria sp.]|nr:hypothetical protein [Kutzneria sp.]